MIGAFLSRGESAEPFEADFENEPHTIIKAGNRLTAWCLNDLAHASLASLPDSSDSQRTAVVCGFLGVLFANDDLKKRLLTRVPQLRKDQSAADFLAHGYRHFGQEFIDAVEGEFLAFIFDVDKDVMISRTDAQGVQRFYYRHGAESYCLCSDLPGLLKISSANHVHDKVVLDYFFLGYIPAPDSGYREIRKTLPDHSQRFHAGAWQLTEGTHRASIPDSVDSPPRNLTHADVEGLVLAELERSIGRRLNGARAASVLLTSGHDSSLCASVLKSRCDDVYSYTIGFEERPSNENESAGKIADHLGLKHRDLIFSADQLLDAMVGWVRAHGEPWGHPNGLSTYLAMGEIRKYGTQTGVFDGSGGDSLFHDFRTNARAAALALSIPKTPRYLRDALIFLQDKLPSWRARNLLRTFNLASARVGEDRIVFHNPWGMEHYRQLFGRKFHFGQTQLGKAYFSGGGDALSRLRASHRSWGFDASAGRSVRESNLQGVRASFPYLDSHLVRLMENIPEHLKFGKDNKRFLQESISRRFIPDAFFAERKKAMETPLALVLETERGLGLIGHCLAQRRKKTERIYDTGYAETVFKEFRSGENRHALKLWNLLVYEIWDESRSVDG